MHTLTQHGSMYSDAMVDSKRIKTVLWELLRYLGSEPMLIPPSLSGRGWGRVVISLHGHQSPLRQQGVFARPPSPCPLPRRGEG